MEEIRTLKVIDDETIPSVNLIINTSTIEEIIGEPEEEEFEETSIKETSTEPPQDFEKIDVQSVFTHSEEIALRAIESLEIEFPGLPEPEAPAPLEQILLPEQQPLEPEEFADVPKEEIEPTEMESLERPEEQEEEFTLSPPKHEVQDIELPLPEMPGVQFEEEEIPEKEPVTFEEIGIKELEPEEWEPLSLPEEKESEAPDLEPKEAAPVLPPDIQIPEKEPISFEPVELKTLPVEKEDFSDLQVSQPEQEDFEDLARIDQHQEEYTDVAQEKQEESLLEVPEPREVEFEGEKLSDLEEPSLAFEEESPPGFSEPDLVDLSPLPVEEESFAGITQETELEENYFEVQKPESVLEDYTEIENQQFVVPELNNLEEITSEPSFDELSLEQPATLEESYVDLDVSTEVKDDYSPLQQETNIEESYENLSNLGHFFEEELGTPPPLESGPPESYESLKQEELRLDLTALDPENFAVLYKLENSPLVPLSSFDSATGILYKHESWSQRTPEETLPTGEAWLIKNRAGRASAKLKEYTGLRMDVS